MTDLPLPSFPSRASDLPVATPSRRRILLAGASLAAVWPMPGLGADAPAALPIADAELQRAAQRGELCSTKNAVGTGLRGEYFARDTGRGEVLLARTDGTVDFDRTFEWPAQPAGPRPESARWSGWIKPSIAGRYSFHAEQAAASLVVARQTLLGEGAAAGASIELAAGRFYPITLQLDQIASMKGRLRLEWTAPHGARYLIPRALMFLPTERVVAKG